MLLSVLCHWIKIDCSTVNKRAFFPHPALCGTLFIMERVQVRWVKKEPSSSKPRSTLVILCHHVGLVCKCNLRRRRSSSTHESAGRKRLIVQQDWWNFSPEGAGGSGQELDRESEFHRSNTRISALSLSLSLSPCVRPSLFLSLARIHTIHKYTHARFVHHLCLKALSNLAPVLPDSL